MTLEQYCAEQEDRLSALWTEHLSAMEDSAEHIRYLAASDRAFHEFCEEQWLRDYPEQEEVTP